jgi:hypothetical protein
MMTENACQLVGFADLMRLSLHIIQMLSISSMVFVAYARIIDLGELISCGA